MSNPEKDYIPQMIMLSRGERPKEMPVLDGLGKFIPGEGYEVLNHGTWRCSSANWAPDLLAIFLAYRAMGMKLPDVEPKLSDKLLTGWWINYFNESKSGAAMHAEAGSRIYSNWIMLAVCLVYKYTLNVRSFDMAKVNAMALEWLESFWAAVSLTMVDPGPSRHLSFDSEFARPAWCGARSWEWKDYPIHIDHHLLGAEWQYIMGRRQGLDGESEVFRRCAPIGALRNVCESSVEARVATIGPWGWKNTAHIFGWKDGTRAMAWETMRGLSGATDPLYACSVSPGSPIKCLYIDDGLRSRPNFADKVDIDIDKYDIQVAAHGDIADRKHPNDGYFTTGNGWRAMFLDADNDLSALEYHVIIDKNGARLAGEEPPPPPVTEQPPAPPLDEDFSHLVKTMVMTQQWRKDHGENTTPEGHAGAIAVLVMRALLLDEDLDFENVRKRARLI